MNERKQELISELLGVRCQCGKRKAKGNTFCRGCYYALPQEMRSALYAWIGMGYEQAYQEAIEFLAGEKTKAVR